MSSHVAIISNPAAGGASQRKVEEAAAILKRHGRDVELLYTERGGHATDLAIKAVDEGSSLVIAAGGDGTINEVVNGVAGSDTPMAILPLGTTNVLARELLLPWDVEGALRKAMFNPPRRVTVGRLSLGGMQRLFIMMAGIGFDAEAVYSVHRGIKGHIGKSAYALSSLRKLISWSPETLEVVSDAGTHECHLLIAANIARYAGRSMTAPQASITDPSLHAVLFHGSSRLDLLRYTAGIFSGRHLGMKDVTYIKCRRLEVRGRARAQVDGDYAGFTPAVIESMPGHLKLVF